MFARYLSLCCQCHTQCILIICEVTETGLSMPHTLYCHIFPRYLILCCKCHTHCILIICEVFESLLSMPYTLYSQIFARCLSLYFQCHTHCILTYLGGIWISVLNAIHFVFSHICEVSQSVLSMPYTLYSHNLRGNLSPVCKCHTDCFLTYLRGIWDSIVDAVQIVYSRFCELSESLLSMP